MLQDSEITIENSDSKVDPERILGCLRHYLSTNTMAEQPSTFETRELSQDISKILFGSKKSRLGNAPSVEEIEHMTRRVQKFVDIDAPIEILTLWGAMKGYGQFNDRLGVDVMDVMGIRRYAQLNQEVSKLYEPGLCVKIIREDVGEIALSGDSPTLAGRIQPYRCQLDKLVNIIGTQNHVRFIDESKRLVEREVSQKEFIAKGKHNAQIIFDYVMASAAITDESAWESIPEYGKLLEMGWSGIIPQETRDHYKRRVETEYPGMSEQEKVQQICTYLGNALARVQIGLFQGTYTDRDGVVIPPIRTSFVPYPPGTPSNLRIGRVDYKVKDAKRSNNSTPPWCGFGFMIPSQREGIHFEPSMVSLREYREMRESQYEPVVAKVMSEKGALRFRSDVLAA